MQVSTSWLRDYVGTTLSVHRIADRLTMTLNEVDEIRSVHGLAKVRVGEVVSVRRHPGADTLWITRTKVGRQEYQIVCGADNVVAGAKVAVALPGITLPDGMEIGVRKIRGVESHGMLCSPKELGIGEDHAGIWLLPADTLSGKSLPAALKDSLDSFELEVLANRPDCLGHLGVAREVAAATGARFKEPTLKFSGRTKRGILSIKTGDGCNRFTMARLIGLTNQESPDWLKRRLIAVGLKPRSAIIDITNFVMLEYGQPLHAYDAGKLTGTVLLARNAQAGETVTTLDGKRRTLDKQTLVIADRTQVLGIAGIMGGRGSEVARGTTEIILECANFDGPLVRRTSRRLGLRTDASARFEKGLPAAMTLPAIRRAIDLLQEICGGQVTQFSDAYPAKQRPGRIALEPARLERWLGVTIPASQVKQHLARVGVTLKGSGKRLSAVPPYWRSDLNAEEDLFEEVIRLHGYDKLPATQPVAALDPVTLPPATRLAGRLREAVVGSGYTEIITHSLVGRDLLKKAGYPGSESVAMANPLSTDHELLRRSMEPRHLEAVQQNLRWASSLRLFEIGKTFKQSAQGEVVERTRLAVTVAGKDTDSHLNEVRGVLTALSRVLKLPPNALQFKPTKESQYQPGRQFEVISGATVGHLAEYRSPSLWKAGSIAFLSLEIDRLNQAVPEDWKPSTPPEFPPVYRDLSVFVPDGATYADLAALIRTAGGEYLEEPGEPREFIKDGKRSLAVALAFRHPTRTLKDAEVTTAMRGIEAALKAKNYAVRE